MKNILIIYGYHDSGHYFAAKAIGEELRERGYQTRIDNIWRNKSETIDVLFSIFREVVRHDFSVFPDFLIDKDLLEKLAEETDLPPDVNQFDTIISIHPALFGV